MIRHGRWGLLAFVLALGAMVPVPQETLNCNADETAIQCLQRLEWDPLDQWDDEDTAKWLHVTWATDWSLSGDAECYEVQAALIFILQKKTTEDGKPGKPDWKGFGTPKDGTNAGGHYVIPADTGFHALVINDGLSEDAQWEAIKHEAAHHAGFDDDTVTADHFDAYDAEDCDVPPNDDDDNGGGGGSEDDPGTGETCTTSTDWVPVQRDCSYWSGGSLPDLIICTEIVYVPVEVVTCD